MRPFVGFFSFRGASRNASKKPSGILSPPSSARPMKPSKALSDRSVHDPSLKAEIDGGRIPIGLSEAVTFSLASSVPQAAFGHGSPSVSGWVSSDSNSPGDAILAPIQRATGTDTALPTIRQASRGFQLLFSISVHPGSNP